MRIALSADESDPPAAVRYEVLSDGTVVETVHASTGGSTAFGNLDVYASPSSAPQAFSVIGVDTDGNQSATSNPITRLVRPAC
jgi:hypothetical protein